MQQEGAGLPAGAIFAVAAAFSIMVLMASSDSSTCGAVGGQPRQSDMATWRLEDNST